MPPTDCPEGSTAADCATSTSCAPDLTPVHHGTDPDLTAPADLPMGVTGLDLSPHTTAGSFLRRDGRVGVNPLQAVAMAKRKQRSAPHSNSSGNIPLSPAARSARGFSKHEGSLNARQPKRAAMQHAASKSSNMSEHQPADSRYTALVEREEEGSEDALGEGPPGFEPLVARVGGKHGKPWLSSSVCKSPGAESTGTELATPDSDGGSSRESEGPAREDETGAPVPLASASVAGGGPSKDIEAVMSKATKAAAHIRLLLHAQRCQEVGCREPGCEAARQLVVHMRGCSMTDGKACKPTCVQARRLLAHYAECSRKRALLGSRYCLVCSLVARSATNTNGNGDANRINNRCFVNASSPHNPRSSRTPPGRISPGVPPSRYAQRSCGGMRSPVGLSRLRRPDMSHGQVMRLAAAAGGAVSGEPSQGVLGGRARLGVGGMVAPGGRQKDGVFFRPLPCMKARSGSWGGYDRRALMRRTRFDSIPEGLAEEEDDDLDQETASEEGSESMDESSRSNSDTRSSHPKTFMSSHSL